MSNRSGRGEARFGRDTTDRARIKEKDDGSGVVKPPTSDGEDAMATLENRKKGTGRSLQGYKKCQL